MKIVEYFLVGALSALLDFIIFLWLIKIWGISWFISNIISFSISVIFNYLISIKFVFQSKIRYEKHVEFLLVFFLSLLALVINQSILFIMISEFRNNLIFSKIIATSLVFLINFTGRRYFIFKLP